MLVPNWLVTNIQILSPTYLVSNIRHQYRCKRCFRTSRNTASNLACHYVKKSMLQSKNLMKISIRKFENYLQKYFCCSIFFFGILKIRKMETASKTENKADQTKQQVFYRLICLMVEIVFSWNLRLKNFINVFKIWKFWNLTHFKRKVTMKVISIIILLMIRPGKRLPSLDAVFIHCSDNLPVDWLTVF